MKIKVYNFLFNKFQYEKFKLIKLFNSVINTFMRRPIVNNIDITLDYILLKKASISRYGDGEFDIIFGRSQGFQKQDIELANRLKEVLIKNGESPYFLVGIPDCFGNLSQFIPEAQLHWRIRLDKERFKWYQILNRSLPYYQAQISRFYHDWADKSRSTIWVQKLKKIWEGRNVLIVEGDKSRMGVGNDLFDLCTSIRRILCPSANAYSKYDIIKKRVFSYLQPEDLVLIALGPTATILAYDIFVAGFQAIDIGHIDLEYEWMKMNAIDKVRIPGRYMNELDGGELIDDSIVDSCYERQIIIKIE